MNTPGPLSGDAALIAAGVCGFVGFGCVYAAWAVCQFKRQ